MAVPELNEDIVTIICDLLINISDLCAISLACSSFRPLAVKRLISICPIHVTGGKSIQRFHAFVFADAPARTPLIRALGIETGPRDRLLPPQPGDAALLIDILTACQHLERISFRRLPSSPQLTEDPGVIDAIASIRSLRSLSVESTDAVAVSFISKICAPLRILDVSCSFQEVEEVQFCWYPTAFRDPLSRLAPTLQELSFRFLFVDPDIIREIHLEQFSRPAPPLSSWEQYPAVRSLSVRCLIGRLLLEPLQHLFPALDGALSLALTDLRCPEDTFPDMRAINQRVQAVTSRDGLRMRGWTKLDRVACGPAAFYILALRCPIRLAIIEGILGVYAPRLERDWIAVSLRENPVPRLTLGLRLDDELEVLDGLFGPEIGATLTHLSLTLETVNVGRWPNPPPPAAYSWSELLDKVLSSLEPLHRLTHLHVVIHSECPDFADSNEFEPLTPAEELQHAVHPSVFDFQGTATALARPLPSLQFLSLTTCGRFLLYEEDRDPITKVLPQPKRWAASRAWSVPKRNADVGLQTHGEPSLVELQDEEAEEIIEKEELVLPDELYNTWWLVPNVDLQAFFVHRSQPVPRPAVSFPIRDKDE